MTARIVDDSEEALFRRIHALEVEVRELRSENARLRKELQVPLLAAHGTIDGGDSTIDRAGHRAAHGSGEYSLADAERAFRGVESPSSYVPRPPTYRELPAVEPHVPSRPPPPPRAPRTARSKSPPPLDVGYVNRVSESELDTLPYGLVVLDRDGRILFYNETESRLTGFSRSRVTGRNFFSEVAPCTAVREFEGVFREFVTENHTRTVFFDFAFHFDSGTQDVLIALSPGRRPGQVNVMMLRK